MADKSGGAAMKTLFWISLSVFWIGGPLLGLQTEPPPPARSPALTESLNRSFQLISDGKFKEARAELERSQTLAAGPCGECLLGMSHIYASQKDWKRTKEAVKQALPLLPTPGLKARAYDQLGTAAFLSRDVDEAEDSFRRAVSSGGAWGTLAQYNLAQVLLTRQRWAEAAETARGYIKNAGPDGMAFKQAHIVLCQARMNLSEAPTPPYKPSSETAADIEKVGGEVTRPEILSQTRPVYTEEARKAKVTGIVIVEAIIDQEGCVTNVRPLQGLPKGLTESAETAVRRWVFKPATLAGAPVKVYYVLSVNFQVQSGPPVPAPPGTIP
jgi:TonB family protein